MEVQNESITDTVSSMNYQLRAEPNIYYQHPLADTIASQSTSPITHDQYSSRDETPEESSGTQ